MGFDIAVVPRHRILVHKAIATMNLYSLVSRSLRLLGGKQLCHRSLLSKRLALHMSPSCFVIHKTSELNLHSHIGQFELNSLKVGDGATELFSLSSVFESLIVAGLR